MTPILLSLLLTVATDPAAVLTAASAVIDRGEVKAGAPLQQAFRLTNSSDRDIAITGLVTSCGCVRHAFSRDKLAPGEIADLTVEVNTIAQASGHWKWTATVKFAVAGSDVPRSLDLRMSGKLVREISVTPPALALSVEGEMTQTITIVDSRARPLTPKAVASTAKFLSATIRPGEKAGLFAVDVCIAADAPAGRHDEVLVLTTGDSVYAELRIPVQLIKRAKGAVRSYPESIELIAGEGTALVQLRRADGKPLNIATVETTTLGVQLKWSTTAGPVATVRVILDPVLAGRSGKAEVKVTFTDPTGEILLIPVSWSSN